MRVIHESVLRQYFWSGRSYVDILKCLRYVHGVIRSLRWLKRKFKAMGLVRKNFQDPSRHVLKRILKELLNSPLKLRGYRSIWRMLHHKYHMSVRRDTIMKIMREVDLDGVKARQKRRLKRRTYFSKGPNYIWHVDGNDKLKPYGFCLHACIDGFSRKIIWFNVGKTNKDPKIVARHYLEAIEGNGCPMIIRTDYGTENSSMAKIHIAMRTFHTDERCGKKSFIYGPSTANIRIEAFWSLWRRFVGEWWMSTLKGVVESGFFSKENLIHQYTAYIVFGNLLKKDIEEFVTDWNNHPIRRNCRSSCPHGRPADIYSMPILHGTADFAAPVHPQLWAHCMLTETCDDSLTCPEDFTENAVYFLEVVFGLTLDQVTHQNCVEVYLNLSTFLCDLLLTIHN